MPQFDLLIIHTQSTLFISLVILMYLLFIYFYILPVNQTGKCRSKMIMKNNANNILINKVFNKYLNKLIYKYQVHLGII